MKGILKRLTLVILVFAMAMVLMASPSMAVMATASMAEEELVTNYYAYILERSETLGDFDNWPLEEKAAFAAWVKERFPDDENHVCGVPGEENMKMAEAIEMARQGIVEKYAIKEAVLWEMFYEDVTFYTHFFYDEAFDADGPMWVIFFRVINYREYGDDLGFYTVILYDQTKEMVITSAADSVG